MNIDFNIIFEEITGNKPFPWQKRLYQKFIKGEIPCVCDIPTGLGKTSVLPVWLIAFCGKDSDVHLPRRLVYVVNRRTIVDQSTEVVMNLREKLNEAIDNTSSPLYDIAKILQGTGVKSINNNALLAVSTLRGELADNLEWRFDPASPAVIIGTVDMIGSKLLFSGYGDSRRVRPLNAGLLGCDTLVVHDEAHLTPAFSQLIQNLGTFQGACNEDPALRPLQVLELSATCRDSVDTSFKIDDSDKHDPIVEKRLNAGKKIHLHEVEKKGKPLQQKMVDLALVHNKNKSRIVIFVRSPEDATKIQTLLVKQLKNQAEAVWKEENHTTRLSKQTKEELHLQCALQVSILTGEIRGYERDNLLEKPGMLPFTGNQDVYQTVYLIATSAGEVGMDLHADHMVSDLTTLDSMIQRLGRVNRFGQTDAQVDVVYETTTQEDKDQARQNTLALLKEQIKKAGPDLCPMTLLELLERDAVSESFQKVPEMVDTTDILLDLWSQTSIEELPARPEVAPWLHGIQNELPETWMAWREELPLLAESDLTTEEISRWFEISRITSSETLRMPSFKLKWSGKKEKQWVEKHQEEIVFVLSINGKAQKMTISELAGQNMDFNFATIVFPPHLGGLDPNGFFNIEAEKKVRDVAQEDSDFQRIVLYRFGDGYRFLPLEKWQEMSIPDEAEEKNDHQGWYLWSSFRNAARQIEDHYLQKTAFRLKVRKAREWQDEDNLQECWLILLKEKKGPGKKEYDTPTVEQHNRAAAQIIRIMAEKLLLPEEIRGALYLAAKYHDIGKNHDRWQKAAGFDMLQNNSTYFAKAATGGINWHILDGYRHECGSVLQSRKIEEVKNHPEADLILHLIAAHHGWARPHFEDRAFPPEIDDSTRQQVNLEIMKRYVRLQKRYGYWQLAWLESLLRRADGMASAQQVLIEEESDV